jgi:NADPH-dependent curcumin reductase CurA
MPTAPVNKRFVLAERPTGRAARETDFRLETAPVPEPADGEVLLRTLYLSLDPYMRGRMSAARSYAQPVEIGAVMTGEVVAEVAASRHPGFRPGEIARAHAGWQQYAALPGEAVERLEPEAGVPLSYYLGVLGMPGHTAYCALLDIGKPQPGETVVISAASGAVGQAAGQIAKLKGCRVVGIAGAPDKLAYVRDELGFDAVLQYRGKDREALAAELAAAAPQGVDVFFDNVGGVTHDAVMLNLALHARIIICGTISVYDKPDEPDIGIRWNRQLLIKRALMQGFLVWDHRDHAAQFRRDVTAWLKEGKIRYREDIVDGIEAAPKAFLGLFQGRNRGKLLVRVADNA